MSVNYVSIEGNLTREIELRQAGSKTVISFSIAHNTRAKDAAGNWGEGPAEFYDVEFWPNDPKYWANRLTKGTSVIISGALKQDRWEQDGQARSRVKIVAREIGAKWLPEIQGNSEQKPACYNTPEPQDGRTVGNPKDGYSDYQNNAQVNPEDIPF